MDMTVTKLRKILEILEKHGFGEYIPCIYEGGCIEIGTPSVTTQIEGENIIYLDGFCGGHHSEELNNVIKEVEGTLWPTSNSAILSRSFGNEPERKTPN